MQLCTPGALLVAVETCEMCVSFDICVPFGHQCVMFQVLCFLTAMLRKFGTLIMFNYS